MYKKLLSALLDLPWGRTCLDDANSKLGNCVGYLNGNRVYFVSFLDDGIRYTLLDEKQIAAVEYAIVDHDVKDIQAWLPESGVYKTTKGGVLVLKKLPLRQWCKGFKIGNYEVIPFNGAKRGDVYSIIDDSRTDFWVNEKNKDLMYHDLAIGKMKDERLFCVPLFKQDVRDWIRNESNKTF